MDIAAMSDQEVVALVLGQSLEAQVRKMLHESAGRIEQSYAQREGPSGVQVRRMELEDAVRIVDVVARAERSRVREEMIASFQRKKRQVTPADRYYLSEGDFWAAVDEVCPEEEPR